MMENNVMYSFNQSLPEIGLLENILLVSILTVWWKTISCTASTSLYLKCAGIVTWDVVLNVIFMFAISPWVFWGELYCVFLWTPNGEEYKFLLVCHRNLFCIFSNLSQFFQSVWLFLSCLSLIMIAVLALFYSSPVAPLLLSNEFLVNILWTSYEVHMQFLWNSYEVLKKFMILIKFWSKFGEFLIVSYEILLNFFGFLLNFYEFLLNFSEFLMNFLWISYAVLTQFLCSSYVDFKTSYLFERKGMKFTQKGMKF